MPEMIAVLTGASRGLGRSIALHLARAGVSIIGTYHSQKNEADAVAAEIRASGTRAVMLPFDAADTASLGAFASIPLGRVGRPDDVGVRWPPSCPTGSPG